MSDVFGNYNDLPKISDITEDDRLILITALNVLHKYRGGGMLLQHAISGLTDIAVRHLDFRGWRFYSPFYCMGCGIAVDARQWAFSRSCGPCDVSYSRTRRLLYGKCFAGRRELLTLCENANPDDERGFIPEDHFVDPSEREKYPVMVRPERRPIPPRPRLLPRFPPRKPGTWKI